MRDLWSGRSASDDDGPDGGADGDEPGEELWSGRGDGPDDRRRRPKGISPRTRTTARILLAVLVVGGLGLGGSVGWDLLQVRSSLQNSRTAIAEVRSSLGEVDTTSILASLEVAEDELADAERRSTRPTWGLMTYAPFLGPSVQVTRDVVEVGAAAVEVVGIAARQGSELLEQGFQAFVSDGRIEMGPLLEAQRLVAELPIDRLNAAEAALAQPVDGWLPREVLDGRADTLELATETTDLLTRAEALTEALPGFLGADGPKRYFVGFQTSAELRGTGGLIGYWAVLAVDDGELTFGAGEDYDPFDDVEAPEGESRVGRIRSIGLSLVDPPDVDPAFFARYGRMAGARSFPNINLDPDLPTTAKAILDLYELQTGDRLDGVVLLDPPGLQRLLEPTGGQVPLPDDLATLFGFEGGVPVREFSRFVTADIYEVLGFDRSDERNDALRVLGDAAFTQLAGGGWNGPEMIAAVAQVTAERHFQVFTADDDVQAAFQAVNATGSLEPPAIGDRFAITANNLVGGKQDVHLGHAFQFDLDLEQVVRAEDGTLAARRTGEVAARVDNPLPTTGMDLYVLGNCVVGDGPNRCFEGPPGVNHTWFSLWAPPTTLVAEVVAEEGTRTGGLDRTFRNLRVVDQFVETPSQASAGFQATIDGLVPLVREQEALVYELEWWRQAKAIPDLLDITITSPEAWAIGDVEVVGGGTGSGLGVHGEGEPVTAEVVDGVAHVRGTVTADTRIRVRLVDPAGL